MIRKADVRAVNPHEASKALEKAKEFTASAACDLAAARWNAAGLAAIHAGICAADAALIASQGVRAAGQDHGAAVTVLESRVPAFGASQRRQLAGLLKMKNKVEYESRGVTDVEARQLVDQAERFTRWAGGVVDDHGK